MGLGLMRLGTRGGFKLSYKYVLYSIGRLLTSCRHDVYMYFRCEKYISEYERNK